MDDGWRQVRQTTALLTLAGLVLGVLYAIVFWLLGDAGSAWGTAARGVAMIFTTLSCCAGLALGRLAERLAGFSGTILLIPISVAVLVFALSTGILAESITRGVIVRQEPLIFLSAAVIWCVAAWCAATDYLR